MYTTLYGPIYKNITFLNPYNHPKYVNPHTMATTPKVDKNILNLISFPNNSLLGNGLKWLGILLNSAFVKGFRLDPETW